MRLILKELLIEILSSRRIYLHRHPRLRIPHCQGVHIGQDQLPGRGGGGVPLRSKGKGRPSWPRSWAKGAMSWALDRSHPPTYSIRRSEQRHSAPHNLACHYNPFPGVLTPQLALKQNGYPHEYPLTRPHQYLLCHFPAGPAGAASPVRRRLRSDTNIFLLLGT